jgi:hypothetical protein
MSKNANKATRDDFSLKSAWTGQILARHKQELSTLLWRSEDQHAAYTTSSSSLNAIVKRISTVSEHGSPTLSGLKRRHWVLEGMIRLNTEKLWRDLLSLMPS